MLVVYSSNTFSIDSMFGFGDIKIKIKIFLGVAKRLSSMKDSWFSFSSSSFSSLCSATNNSLFPCSWVVPMSVSCSEPWLLLGRGRRRGRRRWVDFLVGSTGNVTCSMTGVFSMSGRRKCSRSCCNDLWVGKNTRSIRQYWLVVAQSRGEVVSEEVYHR